MQLDIVSLGDHLLDPNTHAYAETQAERFETLIDMGVRAEQAGFGAYWLGEHHASDYIVSSPQMILAAVAARTASIRLGTAVSLLPNNDPVRLAEDFATLDLISKGRAELGFGSGITEHTFRLFGQDAANAAAMSAENLELLLKLWTEENVAWSGKFRAPIVDTKLEPRTFSGKAIPITRATGGSEPTAREAGRAGHKLALLTVISGYAAAQPMVEAYRAAYKAAGHDPAGMRVSGAAFVYVRPDGKKAKEQFAAYMANYQAFTQMLLGTKGMSRSLGELVQAIMQKTPAALGDAQMAGDPSEIVDRLESAREAMGGADEMKILFDVGGQPRAEVMRSIDLFAEKVLPQLSKAPVRPAPRVAASNA